MAAWGAAPGSASGLGEAFVAHLLVESASSQHYCLGLCFQNSACLLAWLQQLSGQKENDVGSSWELGAVRRMLCNGHYRAVIRIAAVL